ncbi:MAG: DUF418 domain-containing protein [Chitinophagaceae bacterium]|nr:DUF418 domain-containing protein [Chitinophagaceae bacterium]
MFFSSWSWVHGTDRPGLLYPIWYRFFILQIILSTQWLKYFNYGPLEWLLAQCYL